MILVYVTYKNKREAEKIVGALLNKRLVACATIFPVMSMYTWKGKRERTTEYVSLIKTQNKLWSKVKSAVTKLHSYDTPCIVKLPAEANSSYEAWVRAETR